MITISDDIDISLGSGGGYYGGKANIHIHAADEQDREGGWDLTYEFSQPGWDFETTYQLEAAALIAGSKFWNDPELEKVPAEKENLDQQWADAAYWCSGGNALWKFGQDEDFVGNWNESKDEVEKLFRERYEKDVLACSNLLEIVAVMKNAKDNFLTVLYDECPDLWDYDDEYEEDDEDEVEVEPMNEEKETIVEDAEQYEGTRFFVESWEAASTEDDWENGESNRVSSAWDDSDIKVNGTFDTVAAAVEAVCEANYFTFRKENWVALADESTLHGDVLVDEDNQEASPRDIEAWKKGEKRLWNCHLTVHVMKRTAPQPCSEEELLAEFEEG